MVNIRLNDPVAYRGKIGMVTEYKKLGLDMFIMVIRSDKKCECLARTFWSQEMACDALIKELRK